MSEQNYRPEELAYLGDCIAEASNVDAGIQAGITSAHFTHHHLRSLWGLIISLRGEGKHTDESSLYAEASKRGSLPEIGGVETLVLATQDTTGIRAVGASSRRTLLCDLHAKREAYKLLQRALTGLKDGTVGLDDVRGMAEKVGEVCAGKANDYRQVDVIAADAIAEAESIIAGVKEDADVITTGIPSFDKYASPIRKHEYVLVAGRSSHGKSSLMLQIAGHNLARGKRVAVFSLETSDKAVVKQIAGQKAGVDLRNLDRETKEKQMSYIEHLRHLQSTKNLLVFDHDLSLAAIESRCRLIAQSFRPHLVILDYIGLMSGVDGTAYERASKQSKAMIPVQKHLGCTLMVGCQLNQGAEKEEREPTRTDARDSGQLLEDCHRFMAIWRKPNQPIDNQWFESELLQLKLRDGALCKSAVRFHAPSARFVEMHTGADF
jgi:replicative DNA helicase